MKSNIKNTKGPKKAGAPPAPKPKGQMGTRKFLEQFNQHPNINYGLFQRKSDGKVFEWEEFLELFNNQQTASQQQTIERLILNLKRINTAIDGYWNGRRNDSQIRIINKVQQQNLLAIKEAEQLLNTTEPIDHE